MDSSNRLRIRQIFMDVADLPESDWPSALAAACGPDQSLRAEVERLLMAERNAGGFMENPTDPAADAGGPDSGPTGISPITERAGSRVGPYKLLQVIGEGGFGTVFLAEQSQPVRRRVALKIIKLGMDTRQVIARFEAERQALAIMDHPHIARVFDGGATETGRPYFVMEYVAGETITAFALAHKLTVKERIALFAQVCQAVQHAHHKGIIHRDLKPSNVLVTMTDGRPFAKVIDFGIAKATGAAGGTLTDKTLFTEHRQLIGTPEYMSPEQAEGSPDIDTRTDVYALGVLLYELLTGLTPFDGRRLRSAAWAEMQRIIREEEPPTPSLRLERRLLQEPDARSPRRAIAGDAQGEHPPAPPNPIGRSVPLSSAIRASSATSVADLRGELDWIVMKALDKDRARRYDTPGALAADLERHLTGDAVVAVPPSAAYRLRKFVKRNRRPVAAGSAVGLALVLGMVGTAWGWHEARTAVRSLNDQIEATRVSLGSVVGRHAPSVPEGGDEIEIRDDAGRTMGFVLVDGRSGAVSLFGPESPLAPSRRTPSGIEAVEMLAQFASDQATRSERLASDLQASNTRLRDEVKRARLAEAAIRFQRWQNEGGVLSEGARIELEAVLATRTELLGPTDIDTVKVDWLLATSNQDRLSVRRAREAAADQLASGGSFPDIDLLLGYTREAGDAGPDLELARRWVARLADVLEAMPEADGIPASRAVRWGLGQSFPELAVTVGRADEATVPEFVRQLRHVSWSAYLASCADGWTSENRSQPAAAWRASIRDECEQIASLASAMLEESPNDVSALAALAAAQRSLGRFDDAIATTRRAMEARPAPEPWQRVILLSVEAVALHELGRVDDAISRLTEARAARAQAGAMMSDVPEQMFLTAERNDPTSPEARQAAEEWRRQRLESASFEMTRTLGDPDRDFAYRMVAGALAIREEILGEAHPETLDSMLRLAQLAPRGFERLYLYQRLIEIQRDPQAALPCRQRALAYELYTRELSDQGRCGETRGAAQEAVAVLSMLTDCDQEVKNRLEELALFAIQGEIMTRDHTRAAIRSLAQPSDDLDFVRGRLEAATNAMAEFPADAPLAIVGSLAQHRLGQHAEAVALAERAIELRATAAEPAQPVDQAVLALSHFRLGGEDHVAKAHATLVQLRAFLADPATASAWASDAATMSLVREAEELIGAG